MVRLCLSQGEVEHMLVTIPNRVNDKMVEIVQRDPKGTWACRQLDLLKQAHKELEEEGWTPKEVER